MRKLTELLKQYINDYKLVPQYSTILFAFMVMIVSLICFFSITDLVTDNELKHYDDVVIAHIIAERTPNLTAFMKSMTFIGNSVGYFLLVPIVTVFFIIRKNWRISLEITIVLILSSGLNVVLKRIISRPRPPEINRLVFADFTSFPSGHAMSAITFYGFIIYLSYLLIKKYWLKYSVIIICCLMVLLIGFSRVYLGVHYPSDILAGYFAGIAWLMFCIIILNLITLRKLKIENSSKLT
ncbi:phosphatase PAP2 family protein [Pedobacter alpinus]|uniref:Phosphatase PAP2 family protein n=1 Tax=Pedobacter alpinus TaxID=1590643 RepID=A0ABW5TVG3_9SPHI